jgi:low affinity Fe/Cu permease
MEKEKDKSKKNRREPASGLVQQFSQFAHATSLWTGHPYAFLVAVGVVLVWALLGPVFNYSDTWQLVINTGTTIVTFLMVFLIQNTQNRDTLAIQIKLSELVLAVKGAENKFAAIEDLTDEELERLHDDCRARVETTSQHLQSRRKSHTGKNHKSATASRARSPARQAS